MLNRIYSAYTLSHKVVTDSRQITPGCIFFAFRGQNFNGNAFAAQALEQGAALCVIDDPNHCVSDRCIVVDDVLRTLQDLAIMHRSSLTIPVIGITGTNGKTTTKELVSAVLSRRYRTAATVGNHNNHLGVPLTLLSIPVDAEMAVVEMGANHPGEIADLCRIANPDCGLITNVGVAHIEGFGSFDMVVHTKTELYRHLAQKHGLIFVDADNKRLMAEAEKLATIPSTESALPAYMPGNPLLTTEAIANTPLFVQTYGISHEANVRGTLIDCSPYLKFYFEVGDNVYTVQTHLVGAYNLSNCLAAVSVGLQYGVDPFDIKQAIEDYVPSNQRSEFRKTTRNSLYLDCYNANPSSMAAALDTFATLHGRKAAIIGGMRELGSASQHEHKALIDRLDQLDLEAVMLVGSEFDGLNLPPHFMHFATTEALAQHLRSMSPQIADCTILIKGSNGNRLWTLAELL